jgi:hypothetical protein
MEVLGWLGFIAFLWGWWQVYPPVAYIVGGGLLFVISALGSRRTPS